MDDPTSNEWLGVALRPTLPGVRVLRDSTTWRARCASNAPQRPFGATTTFIRIGETSIALYRPREVGKEGEVSTSGSTRCNASCNACVTLIREQALRIEMLTYQAKRP